jgi:hypothetical protein
MAKWLEVGTEYEQFKILKQYEGKQVTLDLAEVLAACAFTEIYGLMTVGTAGDAANLLAEQLKTTIQEQQPEAYNSYFVNPSEEFKNDDDFED